MKRTSLLLTICLLAGLNANAASSFREIVQKQCVDSEGEVIADAGFNYTKVMVNEQASLLAFLTTVDGCNKADFVFYLANSMTVINGEKMTQVSPVNDEVSSKNCRSEISKENKSIFQSAQIKADQVTLTTPQCAELTLTLKALPAEQK